jgi:hypothetical protein
MQTAILTRQVEVTFTRKADARRVSRRLRDYNVLSRVVDRKVVIEIPTRSDAEKMRELAARIQDERA